MATCPDITRAKAPAGPLQTLPAETRLVAQLDLTVLLSQVLRHRLINSAFGLLPSKLQSFRDDVGKIQRVTYISFAPLLADATSDGAIIIAGQFNTRRVHKLLSSVVAIGDEDLSVASLPSGAVAIGDRRVVKRLLTARFNNVKRLDKNAPLARALAATATRKRAPDIIIATRQFGEIDALSLRLDLRPTARKARKREKRKKDTFVLFVTGRRSVVDDLATNFRVFRAAMHSPGFLEEIRDRLAETLSDHGTAKHLTQAADQLLESARISRPSNATMLLRAKFDASTLLSSLTHDLVDKLVKALDTDNKSVRTL